MENEYWDKKDRAIRVSQAYNLAHADMIQKTRTIIDTEYLNEIKERTRLHYATLTNLQKEIEEQLNKNQIKLTTTTPTQNINLNTTTTIKIPPHMIVTEEKVGSDEE